MKNLYNISIITVPLYSVLLLLVAGNPASDESFAVPVQNGCTVSELSATSVRESRAALSYKVRGTQVVEFGVCYGKDPSPDVKTGQANTSYEGEPRDIPSDVAFKVSVTGLESGKEYHARAYARDSKGNIFYSAEIAFTTVKKEDFSSMLNGPKTDYYPSGHIRTSYTARNGKPHGSVKFYSDSGYMVSDQYLVDGVANGYHRTYYNDGTLKSDANYKDGLPFGPMKEYYPNGNIKTESQLSGEPFRQSGITKLYFEEGALRSETTISLGQLVQSTGYDKEGRVTREESPGMYVSYSYDSDGWKHTSINGEKCKCSKCN